MKDEPTQLTVLYRLGDEYKVRQTKVYRSGDSEREIPDVLGWHHNVSPEEIHLVLVLEDEPVHEEQPREFSENREYQKFLQP